MSFFYTVLLSVLSLTACTVSQQSIVIHSPSNGRPLYEVFVRRQSNVQIFSLGPNINYITGLNAAFHVTKNTLFKVMFQGAAQQHVNGFTHIELQIMVNDRVISGADLKPNTAGDDAGGIYWHHKEMGSVVFVSRMAMVYLRPGTYSFNVGVKTIFPSLELHNGLVHYELTQFDDQDQKDVLGDLRLT